MSHDEEYDEFIGCIEDDTGCLCNLCSRCNDYPCRCLEDEDDVFTEEDAQAVMNAEGSLENARRD